MDLATGIVVLIATTALIIYFVLVAVKAIHAIKEERERAKQNRLCDLEQSRRRQAQVYNRSIANVG